MSPDSKPPFVTRFPEGVAAAQEEAIRKKLMSERTTFAYAFKSLIFQLFSAQLEPGGRMAKDQPGLGLYGETSL
jgi:hypothetical protein